MLRENAARRASRDELTRTHPEFRRVSPQAGQLDQQALADLTSRDPDAAARLLAALTGKVTLADGAARRVEDVVSDIWRRAGEELGKG